MPAITAASGPVAVTGVSGYTGGHMVRELVHHGYEVRACLRDASSWRGQDAIQYLEKLPGVTIVDGYAATHGIHVVVARVSSREWR